MELLILKCVTGLLSVVFAYLFFDVAFRVKLDKTIF